MPPALGFDPGSRAAPAPRAFRGLAWLQAWSVQGCSGGTKCRNAVDRAAPGGAKVRPAGRAASGFQRWTRTPSQPGPHTLQLPASRNRVPTLGGASVTSPTFAFVSQVIHNYLSPQSKAYGYSVCSQMPRAQPEILCSEPLDEFLFVNSGPAEVGPKQRPRPRWS